jgi:hypothetical protein
MVRDMILNKATGDIYVSCFTAKVIKVLNQEGEVDIFASMDMHPAGIGVTNYGDVFNSPSREKTIRRFLCSVLWRRL